ncbi:AbrB/MazE/SpoVT family DNA-binding domain-containing protein [Candidatus Nitrosotenuis aquarius]|uniref:AbrB/MazE/SpoVT family DNA-binding domain-containing protein n=1 Tax=Candidatus Nitrosotenuis aquarius TaxID=1846278 RepID=UPI001FE532DA|nr:AbrB/MazE/SpoVT family DNA-binding domain-containing protein [Candidatus Nitrosotenuis aquarius]
MFQEWVQKGGRAQAEFMKAFSAYMENNQKFDPVNTLKELTTKSSEAQANLMTNMSNTQKNVMEQFFNMGNLMQNFIGYGAFKTTIGSNGRISIPEAERDALRINEGDLVQVVVIPLEKKKRQS